MLDKIKESVTSGLDEGKKMEIANHAQMDLINMAGEAENAGIWIDANGTRFRQIIDDKNLNLYERLNDKDTHDEALKEITEKLYN